MFLAVEWVGRREWHPLALEKLPVPARWLIYTGIFWTIMMMGTKSTGAFIYIQF